MKTQRTVLRLFTCLAVGGMVTIVVICFLIGFGFHSAVGKYALYTALFLQFSNLGVNHLIDRSYSKESHGYTPSKKMSHFRSTVISIWVGGAFLQMASLFLILCGLKPTDLWVRILCVPGVLVCPIGWAGILLASHRRRCAIEDIQAKKASK